MYEFGGRTRISTIKVAQTDYLFFAWARDQYENARYDYELVFYLFVVS